MFPVLRRPISSAIGVLTFLALTACVDGAYARIVRIEPSNVWTLAIAIDKHPKWIEGARQMAISPRYEQGDFYIPRDLSGALVELDRMLPDNYSGYLRRHTSAGECLVRPTEEVALLHAFLIDMLADKWFSGRSRLSRYFDRQYAGAGISAADRIRPLKAAWLLCTYYNWKRTDVFPANAALVSSFRMRVMKPANP